MSRPLRLSAEYDLSVSNGPSRSYATVQGVTQAKIVLSAKNTKQNPSLCWGLDWCGAEVVDVC